ncbi:MAG: ABC transporter ATP-binding protein [Deltaproteobacteria bacterium]|nr:ABC transporter ATP-binding protein [Deltaproteobacteria bacterium]MBW1951994.1 ABC transporter ATP-binding protein [Deltaproteobacteria bacterium]MBW1987221.1 ABC transporter ATP-binding protein [Deltaproteobacteria bacterium]MBW2134298.1 ABC transporter ATP-binding protein [Deltaproteobacteria bacterium]
MELAIAARGIDKAYRRGFWPRQVKPVLLDLDLEVSQGVIFGILGPNGVGKTTLISILATLLAPDAGEVSILGLDIRREVQRLRQRINLAGGAAKFIWSLTVTENLRFYGRLYGLWGQPLTARIEELIELFELQPYRRVPFDRLSSGLKQRLALAKSLINAPQLLFLDEPTSGLDPVMAQHTRDEIRRLNQITGLTILLTTHNMREAEYLCDEVAFLQAGRIMARGTIPELQTRLGIGDQLILTFEKTPDRLDYSRFPGLLSFQERPPVVELVVDQAELRLAPILTELQRTGNSLAKVQLREVDLEVLYREITH